MKSFKEELKEENIGLLGEDIACRHLSERGFTLISRNFSRKWGEIDIIARKEDVLSFVEVKSVTCEIKDGSPEEISHVTARYNPEERVHAEKAKRLSRTIQSYLAERGEEDSEWNCMVIAVFLDPISKRALVRRLEDVSLS